MHLTLTDWKLELVVLGKSSEWDGIEVALAVCCGEGHFMH